MKTSENINEIATALALAQAEMKNATLNKVNPHFKSRYADLAEIRDKTIPFLTKNGIAVVQGTAVTEGGLAVVNRLVHKSGQWIETCFPIAQDKPQAMGTAITYGRRYLLSAAAAITADEDDDANTAQERPKPPQKYDRSPIVRAEFDRLHKRIYHIQEMGTVEDLDFFWRQNQDTIKNLPADWKEELVARKDEAKTSLAQKVDA